MRRVLLSLLLLGCSLSLVCCQTCTPNNTVLTGSNFEFAAIVQDASCEYSVPLFKQQGALYSLPELRVVANTTVTFNLTLTGGAIVGFGLTLSPSSVSVSSGDALGLTPTADSVSAGACRAFPESLMANNTFAHNLTRPGQYTTQPCVLTWVVPLFNTNNNYSYFVYDSGIASPPRRIYLVNSTDVPSSSSSGAASSSSSSSSSSSVTPGPSSSSSSRPSSSASTGTGTGSSSTPSTGSSSTGTGSSSSLSSSSIGTSSSSSSSSTPNGAGVNGAGAAVPVIVVVMWTMVSA